MTRANRFIGKPNRIASLLLIVVTLALLCLSGCGSKSTQDQVKSIENYVSRGDSAAPMIEKQDADATGAITPLDRKVVQNAEISLHGQSSAGADHQPQQYDPFWQQFSSSPVRDTALAVADTHTGAGIPVFLSPKEKITGVLIPVDE